jgi:hypothetical protein
MEEKTLAVIKQPVPSNIVRGIYYIIFGVLMIAVLFILGEDFEYIIEDMPFILIIPIAAVLLQMKTL